MKSKEFVISVINGIEILLLDVDGKKRVPIKPICQALGIDHDSQRKKIQADEILSSVAVLSTSTGTDGKEYQMLTIPYELSFGWLFSINPKNVAESARENVLKYKMECYYALYEYFEGIRKFLQEKEKQMGNSLARVKEAKRNFNSARDLKYKEENMMAEISKVTYNEYKENGFQMDLGL